MDKLNKPGKPFVILSIAVILLYLLSLLPLDIITNGYLKGYDLFSEILKSDTLNTDLSIDTITISNAIEQDTGESHDTLPEHRKGFDNVIDSNYYLATDTFINPRQGDIVIIEDYSIDGSALKNLKNAIVNRNSLGRPVRIAMLGDSYIEGDIFSQHIRELLQDQFGGGGVGYVNMHSDFPGFRCSVKQSSKGWNVHDFVKNNVSRSYMTISQQYSVARSAAQSTYKGTNYVRHADKWQNSKFLFLTNKQADITLSTDNKTINNSYKDNTANIQCIELSDTTSQFKVSVKSDSLIGIGVWLENNSGITFDCMSTRGCSGITLSRVNSVITNQIANYIEYDMIIIEFGMNAMSAGQKNFSGYTYTMENVIEHLRQCYPNTDILIMGIGDRASKKGNEISSMSNVHVMIAAQRALAKKCNCAFWDTREAMGGENASVKWAEEKLVNKDYIHLSYAGGRKLASEFVKSLNHAIND